MEHTPVTRFTRFLAFLIDAIPLYLIYYVFNSKFGVTTTELESPYLFIGYASEHTVNGIVESKVRSGLHDFYAFVYMVFVFLYFFLMEYKFNASLGKMVFRLRTASTDKKELTTKTILLRNLLKVFLFPLVIVTGIFSPKHIVDYILKTTIVRRKA